MMLTTTFGLSSFYFIESPLLPVDEEEMEGMHFADRGGPAALGQQGGRIGRTRILKMHFLSEQRSGSIELQSALGKQGWRIGRTRLLLIATKILEGTHYVLRPNGSAMFVVNVDEASADQFPWETDGDCHRVEVKQSYNGEGIASGYGFRYPGSKPGSLFVLQNGLLAFVWKESKLVLTLQRIDLQGLVRKGERVPVLPPVANFFYLTKSYSNVFAGIQNCSY